MTDSNDSAPIQQSLAEDHQRKVFLRLVELQDSGTSVEQSRQRITSEFTIRLQELLAIEEQGRMHQWPPLT